MRQLWRIIACLPCLWLTACVASQTAAPTAGSAQAAYDRILTPGDIQMAETHLREFGFDPGPVDGVFTAQTQEAVRAFQRRYGLSVSGLLDYETRLELVPGLDPVPKH
jgi:peptidoglycan hydrolase-like protein with peptidoglycan-binding domain